MTKKEVEPVEGKVTANQLDIMAIDMLESYEDSCVAQASNQLKSDDEKRKITQKDLMWAPVSQRVRALGDSATEVWAARAKDGKRFYNVRRIRAPREELRFGIDIWQAMWCVVEAEKYGDVQRIGDFNSRYDAQNACMEFEGQFTLDPAAVEAESQRVHAGVGGWQFQGVYAGLSIWSMRSPDDTEHCFVITQNLVQAPGEFSLSIRQMGDKFHRRAGDSGYRKLRIKSLGVFPSLEAAQEAVKRIGN